MAVNIYGGFYSSNDLCRLLMIFLMNGSALYEISVYTYGLEVAWLLGA